jgi:hypothetical protein
MYYNRYGQLTTTPDPQGFTGAVSGISGLFSGDVAANVAQVAKTQTEIEQARINAQKAKTEAEKAPYELETEKGKPALQQAQAANLNAEADYRKNQLNHDKLQLEAQARMKAAEDVNKLRINGVLDSDPVKQAKQIGDIYSQYGIAPQGHISSDGKVTPTAPAPGASGALPGPTTTAPNPPGAASPSPAGAPTLAAAATSALPTSTPTDPKTGLPAPKDDSLLGWYHDRVAAIKSQNEATYARMEQEHAAAAWNGPLGQKYKGIVNTLYPSAGLPAQSPSKTDVREIADALKRWPDLSEKMDPRIVQYVKQHTK